MKEIKEIQGVIQSIRNDKKALKINNEWLSSFVTIDDYNVGDNVKVFKNLKDIVRLEKKEIKEKSTISDTTINCLLMQSVQLAKDKGLQLEVSTEKILESYKKIKDSI